MNAHTFARLVMGLIYMGIFGLWLTLAVKGKVSRFSAACFFISVGIFILMAVFKV